MEIVTMKKFLGFAAGAVSLLCASSQVALADNPPNLQLSEPKFIGDGCTKDDTEVALTEDKQSLSILFSKYQVSSNAAGENHRKKCDIRIPVKVPAGFSISIISSEFRGFNFLPRGTKATLSAEYFLVGGRGPKFNYNFPDRNVEDSTADSKGLLKGEFYRKNEIEATALVYGPCGKDTTIAIKSSLDVTSNANGDKADSSLDSLDITSKTPVIYRLTWRACKN